MARVQWLPFVWMTGVVAVLLVITATAGVVTPVIYRPFLSEELVAFQFFQDLVSLSLAPVLVVAMVHAMRGAWRAFVVWIGILIYAAYYYAFYCFDFVYTLYYPLYLAIMGLSTYAFIGLIATVDVEAFGRHVKATLPVRLVSGVLGMTALFVPIWFSMVVQGIQTQQVGPTDLVFVLDLAFLIPACLLAAVQVWRRRPFGYLISGPLLFKATISGILLTGGEMFKLAHALPLAYDQLALYLFLALVGAIGLLQYWQGIEPLHTTRADARSILT